jgi:DNA transformation protein and related proteins
MASSREFADDVTGRLLPFGPVVTRGMFGGFGVFLDGVMFGLIAFDNLYFKVDDANQADYEAEGMEPFSYQGRNRPISLSYWQVPDPVFEDSEQLSLWAEKALGVARRAKSAKKPRKPRKNNKNR